MRLFWWRGFGAVSLRDIVDATGVLSGSLHHAFGSKRGLFMAALRHYDRHHRELPLAELATWSSPRQAICAVFENAVANVVVDGSKNGCLEINAALELAPHDEEIAGEIARAFRGMETFLREAIERGQACGEISRDLDPAETASALLAMYIGIQVLARARPEEELLRSIVRQACAVLG